MTNEPPTKVSPDGPPTTGLPQEKMHMFKKIHTATKESLNNVANSAPKALQAAFKLQWPRSADITDTLLVRNIIGNSTKKNSRLINSPI